MMKSDLQLNSCGFNPDNLDDWLESDLKQSGILPSDKDDLYNDIKLEHPSDWERHSCSDGSDDKTVVDEFELDTKKSEAHTTDTLLPTQLAPILRALAVLTSLHQQGTTTLPLSGLLPSLAPSLSPTTPLTPDAINPIHMIKTHRNLQAHDIPISPNNPNNMNSCNNTSTKRQRDLDTASGKIESLDPLALKRQKNTDAARRSRQRKVMKMERLECRVNELEKQNEQLLLQMGVAEKERNTAQVKESKQREKVAALEAQLAKSHQALVEKQEQMKNEELDTTD